MRSEGLTMELKREYTDDIEKTVIAFAIMEGGEILIGVDDDGAVVGVDDASGMMLNVTNAIRDSIKPVVAVKVRRGTAGRRDLGQCAKDNAAQYQSPQGGFR